MCQRDYFSIAVITAILRLISYRLPILFVHAWLFWCFHNPLDPWCAYLIFLYTGGTSPAVYSLIRRTFAQNLSDTGEISGQTQGTKLLAHPFWWPRSIVRNFGFPERVLLLCATDCSCLLVFCTSWILLNSNRYTFLNWYYSYLEQSVSSLEHKDSSARVETLFLLKGGKT